MQHETEMYEALVDADLGNVIPRFRGYSTHLGVATSCVGRGLDDFDDIGLDNFVRLAAGIGNTLCHASEFVRSPPQ